MRIKVSIMQKAEKSRFIVRNGGRPYNNKSSNQERRKKAGVTQVAHVIDIKEDRKKINKAL